MAVLKNLIKLTLKDNGEKAYGVFYIEHPTRKYGVYKDRQWVVRQALGGQSRISVLGWQTEKINEDYATVKADEYKANYKWNKAHPDQPSKPLCIADETALLEIQSEDYPLFKDFAERFILQHVRKNLKPATSKEYERQIRKHLIPAWGNRKMADIQKKHVVRLIEKIGDTAPVQGNRTLATIKKMFSYALDVDVLKINPTIRMKPPAKETPKNRALEMNEIIILFKVLEEHYNRDTRDILQLIILTGQRPGEVSGMHLSQLKEDSDGLWFALETGVTKNSEPTRIYMNGRARHIIKARINDMGLTNYIFPLDTKSGFMRPDGLVDRTHRIQPLMQELGVDFFTAHDLRRSAATGIARLGYGAVVDDILNHKKQGVTRRVYDLYSRAPEIKRALTAWGEAIQMALDGNAGKIIPIAQGR